MSVQRSGSVWGVALPRRFACTAGIVAALTLLAFAGCDRASPTNREIAQRGYLWQRDWTPAVIDTLKVAAHEMDGVVLLGAEIVFENDRLKAVAASIDWAA